MARYYNSYRRDYGYRGWAPYVPVATRRRQAAQKMAALCKKGVAVQPIVIAGRKIAASFWGKAWCEHLESYSDFENRLPRGRTYVRNGSVCHLAVGQGKIDAIVSGSDLYNVTVSIKKLPAAKWAAIKKCSSGQIGSLLELLQGKLSNHVMEVVTDPQAGLFPSPSEIAFKCSCPDWAYMCKHVAAVLYGVGARLDSQPELLFTLRDVNHEELIDADAELAVNEATSRGQAARLAASELSDVFGIELQDEANAPEAPAEASGAKKERKSRAKLASPPKARVKKTPLKKKRVTKVAVKKAPAKAARGRTAVVKKASAKKASAKKAVVKKAASVHGTARPRKASQAALD